MGYTMDADKSLDRRESQETSVSLLQLDPEPIDTPSPYAERNFEPLIEEDVDGSVSTIKAGSSTGTLGLSGSAGSNGTATGPGAIFYCLSPSCHQLNYTNLTK